MKISESSKEKLKTQIITGILSSPIIYISHFHYDLIDSVIEEILESTLGKEILRLKAHNILEYNIGHSSIINFSTKEKESTEEKNEFLKRIIQSKQGNKDNDPQIILLKDADHILKSGDRENQESISLLLQFTQNYERKRYGENNDLHTIILVSPSPISTQPYAISEIASVINVTPPTEEEIASYIESINLQVSDYYERFFQKDNIMKDFIRVLQGLHMYDIKKIIKSTTIRTGDKISKKTIALALEEKKNIVKKSGIIEVIDANETFDDIGGLNKLKKDLGNKGKIFKNLTLANKYKIALPKGILIIGMPGCGKSLIAKSIANKFGISLLKMDMGKLMGQYVGQSEQNLRKALEMAEAVTPCVLWIDEIEKAFAGSNGDDNNTLIMRLIGYFLTWMQERKTAVYLVATANGEMRPEFMRKGRFDEIYFVDFPDARERQEILKKKIEKYCNQDIFDFSEITDKEGYLKNDILKNISDKMKGSKSEDGFTGAEIEAVVNMLIETKFIEYIGPEKKTDEKESIKERSPIKITEEDFNKYINQVKISALCNQKDNNEIKRLKEIKTKCTPAK